MILDELHGPGFRGAGHRDGPHVGQERVERVEPGPQPALDVVDGVDEAAVHLDLPSADHPDRAGHADPRLVVAVHVGAHGQLGLLLGRAKQGGDVRGVLEGVLAARDRARDRAGLHPVPGDPDVHLGRRADQELPLAQVEQELVGGGIALPQQFVKRGRRRAPAVEHVAGHHLEQVPAGEPFPGLLHHPRIIPWLRLGRQFFIPNEWRGLPRARACGRSGEPGGRHSAHFEVVGVPDRFLALSVQDPDFVWHVQHQVALGRGAVKPEPDRLELERQVIAERPVQAQMRVLAPQRRRDLPQRGEHGRPAAAFLLGELPVALGDEDSVLIHRFAAAERGNCRACPAQRRAQYRQEHAPAVVQRPRGDPPAGGDDLRTRVGVGHVPAAVSPGILHARTHHAAAALVDERRDPAEFGGVERRGGARDPHAITGRHSVRWASTVAPQGSGPGGGRGTQKRPPFLGGRLRWNANQHAA